MQIRFTGMFEHTVIVVSNIERIPSGDASAIFEQQGDKSTCHSSLVLTESIAANP